MNPPVSPGLKGRPLRRQKNESWPFSIQCMSLTSLQTPGELRHGEELKGRHGWIYDPHQSAPSCCSRVLKLQLPSSPLASAGNMLVPAASLVSLNQQKIPRPGRNVVTRQTPLVLGGSQRNCEVSGGRVLDHIPLFPWTCFSPHLPNKYIAN